MIKTGILLSFFLFSNFYQQDYIYQKDIKIELFTSVDKSKNIVAGAIVEVFSGKERIETSVSDFDGISIFHLTPKVIIDNKIILKIYRPKCEIFTKEYIIFSNTKLNIDLLYGVTKYQSHKDFDFMLNELNIRFNSDID